MIRRRPENEAVLLPVGVTEERLKHWERLGFDLCYLPAHDFLKDQFPDDWLIRPDDFFYRLVEEKKLSREAVGFSGHWLLVDGRDKPKKKRWWISRDETRLLEKMGLPLGKILRRQGKKQVYANDFLTEVLATFVAGSRFCLTIKDLEYLKPLVADLISLPPNLIRLPTFAEYNFLGNYFYPQWGQTKTWEWLNDRIGNKHLASGSGSVGCLGVDPDDYWSTILGFRLVVEL